MKTMPNNGKNRDFGLQSDLLTAKAVVRLPCRVFGPTLGLGSSWRVVVPLVTAPHRPYNAEHLPWSIAKSFAWHT